jgi:ketosteroid isomerase-like protein
MAGRASSGIRVVVAALLLAGAAQAQSKPPDSDEIPIERCDVLPVVRVKVAGREMRFLLDTGATTILNLNAFASGTSKEIRVTSWRGAAATSAREVSLPDFQLGAHTLHDLKLPAIDLSPIGKACGGEIDGILGVDLLDRLGVTIDLERKVATMKLTPSDARGMYAEMEASMHHCNVAFNEARAGELEACFDPEIVLYTPDGEYRGRKQVMQYMNTTYFQFAPGLRFEMTPHDIRSFGDALWYSYDYRIDVDKSDNHRAGHGVAMCRRVDGKWQILNMHNALLEPGTEKRPQ